MFISSNSGIQISEELRFFVTTLDLEEAEASPSSPSSPSRARSFTTACHEGGWMAIAMAMEEFPWEFHIYLIDG